MRIVHLNTYDISGGAARAIHRLHDGLLALGEDSKLVVRCKLGQDPTVVVFHPESGLSARLRRRSRRRAIERDARRHLILASDPDRGLEARLRHRLQRWTSDRNAYRHLEERPVGYELFSDDRSALGPELVRGLPEADIVSLNWVAGFVDFESFFGSVPPGRQLVWRLPDMNPFTGGCHYDAGCGRFAESCGNCPQLGRRGNGDLSHQIWQRKKGAYECLSDGQLQVVALSHWQADQARRSSLLGRFPITVIPCGVDVDTFSPRPKSAARRRLGLPADRPVVLMVADIFQRPAKGTDLLRGALQLLGGGAKPLILTAGLGDPGFTGRFEHVHLGLVSDDHLLADTYSAADLLVFPSLQEGFGQTVIEALACGLPVVGFDTGGVRDAVQPGITGFVAKTKTSEALAGALNVALEDLDRLRGMSQACRETAETQFSVGIVAQRYRELYRGLQAGSARPAR